MSKSKFFRYWQILLIIAFTTMLYPIAVGPFSGLMLAIIFFSGIFSFLIFPTIRKDNLPLALLFIFMLFSAFLHFDSFRFSTVAYSFLLISTFACFRRLLETNTLNVYQYLRIIHYIVYAFAIVLLVQQVSILIGIPPFNRCWAFPNPFKLNSLAHEPSYVGATLSLLMYSHLKLWQKLTKCKNIKIDILTNKYLWISYLYVSTTNGSSWTIFTFFLMLAYLLRKKRFSLLLLCIVGVGFFSFINLESIERLIHFIPAIFSGDTELISGVDLSAAARINPLLYYFQDFNLRAFDFWFGYGVDFAKLTLIVRLLGTDEYLEQGNATGGMFSFFYDYGFVALLLFFYSLKKYALEKWISFPFVLWLFFFLFVGFNTYLTWMFFMIMAAIKHYEQRIHHVQQRI